jgi:hypothetical protein
MSDATSHLSEKAAAYLLRPDAERIAYIRSPRWIGYDKAKDTLRRHHALDDAKANRLGWIAAGGDIEQNARLAN